MGQEVSLPRDVMASVDYALALMASKFIGMYCTYFLYCFHPFEPLAVRADGLSRNQGNCVMRSVSGLL